MLKSLFSDVPFELTSFFLLLGCQWEIMTTGAAACSGLQQMITGGVRRRQSPFQVHTNAYFFVTESELFFKLCIYILMYFIP